MTVCGIFKQISRSGEAGFGGRFGSVPGLAVPTFLDLILALILVALMPLVDFRGTVKVILIPMASTLA